MFTIQPGEKWAAICYSEAWCRGLADETDLGNGAWVLGKRPIDVPAHWREWIGSIRSDLIDKANLWLVSKMASAAPGVIDDEIRQLLAKATVLSLSLHTAAPMEFRPASTWAAAT